MSDQQPVRFFVWSLPVPGGWQVAAHQDGHHDVWWLGNSVPTKEQADVVIGWLAAIQLPVFCDLARLGVMVLEPYEFGGKDD